MMKRLFVLLLLTPLLAEAQLSLRHKAIVAATDCTAETAKKSGQFCWEQDSDTWWVCEPSAGDCDTAGEWIKVPSNNSVDGTDIALGSDAQGDVMYYDGTDWARLAAGTTGQVLTTNGAAADPSWQTGIVGGTDTVVIDARKGSVGTIEKGSPVYISGWNASGWIEVEDADADGTGTMPALGVANEDLTNGATGEVVVVGTVSSIDTSSYSVGDALYVSTTAGSLTSTKPTGSGAEIQKMAIVTRSNVSNGVIEVFGAGRSNDVPNLDSTEIWVGSSSNAAAAVTMSGDVNLSNTGVATIQDSAVDGTDIVFKHYDTFILESPADADSFVGPKLPHAITVTDIHCIIDPADTGESVVIDYQECNGTGDSCATVDATITCDNDGAEDDGTLSNAAIDSGDWTNLDIGAVTGTVTRLSVTVYYTID